MINNLSFRYATPGDEGLILYCIRELADYVNMLDEVLATEALLHDWIFVR